MTKTQALNKFWSSFGIPAYDEASVPTGEFAPQFPYITYEVSTGAFGESVYLTGSVWYRSSRWTEANNKAQEISDYIGRGGRMLPCETGSVWIRRGNPFARSFGDPSDDLIKRKAINISAEFLTAD